MHRHRIVIEVGVMIAGTSNAVKIFLLTVLSIAPGFLMMTALPALLLLWVLFASLGYPDLTEPSSIGHPYSLPYLSWRHNLTPLRQRTSALFT